MTYLAYPQQSYDNKATPPEYVISKVFEKLKELILVFLSRCVDSDD